MVRAPGRPEGSAAGATEEFAAPDGRGRNRWRSEPHSEPQMLRGAPVYGSVTLVSIGRRVHCGTMPPATLDAGTGRREPAAPDPGAVPIRAVCDALEREYGNPRHGNQDDPLDELVYIILSTRTQERRFGETFRRLKRAFPRWDDLAPADLPELESILAPGGLGKLKARQILSIMHRLQAMFGKATLDPLRQMTDEKAQVFLTSLWGVSAKVAKCVLMYSLGRQVLPVDVHVHRVATRLGLRTKKRPDTSQDLIESAVPPELRYGFHVNAVAHGRAICLPRAPRCGACCVSEWCAYYHHRRECD
jgi:endonuclease III